MTRKAIKTISNKTIRFIPEEQRDLDESAEKMEDRPMVFVGKPLTNDQKWAMRDLIEMDESKNVKGMGKVIKFLWKTCISEVLNVLEQDEDGTVKELESVKGKEKDALWNTNLEADIIEACNFYREQSELNDEEVKI